jgi:uncharacterized protein with ParB-like and HNH nuclease domain
MNANSRFITQFLGNPDLQFVIPVYQRNYDWSNENCEQLWDDLLTLATTTKNTHFMGALVTIYNVDGSDKEYLIIDGQQRLTTISLLLLALHNSMNEKIVEADFDAQQIMEQYLINKWSEKRRIKLKPIHKDNEAFISLFEGKDKNIESNIFKNYNFFKRKIELMNIKPSQLFEAIKKLEVVEIEVKSSDDNPQLIFESINSTGVSLSEADLVRNFVLMNQNSKTQEEFYKKYWHPMEENTKYSVSDFLKDYLTYKERLFIKQNKIYRAFKKYSYSNPNISIEELLSELFKFSIYYKNIVNGIVQETSVKKILDRLNNLDMTVLYPFLLEIWDDWNNNLINEKQVCEILNILEIFIFRRAICDVPTNALNKIFMVLGKDIKKVINGDYSLYVEALKYLLSSKKGSQRFPQDEEFLERLKNRNVYNLQSKTKLHLLQSLENFENKEEVDLKRLIDEQVVNIEHIMPQTLTPKWQEELGKNALQVHEKYLNTLGNLTLTGYNSKMSNRPFLEKRDMENGFKQSRFMLNKYISEQDSWNEEKIIERVNILSSKALKLWTFFNTDFKPQKDPSKLISLDEETDITGEKPESIIIEETEYKVLTWRDLMLKVLDYLYELDSKKMYDLADNGDRNLTRDKSKLLHPREFKDNLYVEVHHSSMGIMQFIKNILKEYGIDSEQISIYLKENGEQNEQY